MDFQIKRLDFKANLNWNMVQFHYIFCYFMKYFYKIRKDC